MEIPTEPAERVIVVQPGGKSTASWLVVVLLAVIATSLLTRWDGPGAGNAVYGQNDPRVGARGIYAFTGQLSKTAYGLFMMDVDSSTIWCYEYVPQSRRLRLVAARSWHFDRYLEEFNVDAPTPAEVAQLVEKQRSNVKAQANALPAADTP